MLSWLHPQQATMANIKPFPFTDTDQCLKKNLETAGLHANYIQNYLQLYLKKKQPPPGSHQPIKLVKVLKVSYHSIFQWL